MVKKILLFLFLLFFIFTTNSFASSTYVLPYPSTMPGSIFYKIHILEEIVLKYWYFGDFGQFNYNLKASDKYLVEAKTLFDYKQYLLGYYALIKSDNYFIKVKPFLIAAKKEDKNIDQKLEIFNQASNKHIEELEKIKKSLPESFLWEEENGFSKNLELKKIIENSIKIRQQFL